MQLEFALLLGIIGVIVAGLTAVIGIWIERDPTRPPRWAHALTVLIILATLVSVVQSYLDEVEDEERYDQTMVQMGKLEDDLARMLVTLDRLAGETKDPRLAAFVATEMTAQARANPKVIEDVARRVEVDGGDAGAVLGRHLQKSEIQSLVDLGSVTEDLVGGLLGDGKGNGGAVRALGNASGEVLEGAGEVLEGAGEALGGAVEGLLGGNKDGEGGNPLDAVGEILGGGKENGGGANPVDAVGNLLGGDKLPGGEKGDSGGARPANPVDAVGNLLGGEKGAGDKPANPVDAVGNLLGGDKKEGSGGQGDQGEKEEKKEGGLLDAGKKLFGGDK